MDITTATLLLVAIANVATAIIAWRTKKGVEKQSESIHTIEESTNHMKDELVAATHAKGREEGRLEATATAAELAKAVALSVKQN